MPARPLAAGLAAFLLLAGSSAALAPTVLGAPSPAGRYAAVLAAARSMRSVHYVATESSGPTHVTYVGDVTATGGAQRITLDVRGTRGHLTAVVSSHRAWVRGDAFALVGFLDFPRAIAARDANRWIVVPVTDYATVAQDVTLASLVDDLKLTGRLSAVHGKRIAGLPAFGIRGRSAGSGAGSLTLFARAAGPPLPVETVASGQSPATLTFSRWNEVVRLPVPVHAVTVPSGARPSGPAVPA